MYSVCYNSVHLLQMTVREKVEHEIGCHLSSWQRLPTGVCSDCFHIVNEIDVLEHRLDMYRTFLRANVHASITNLGKDLISKNDFCQPVICPKITPLPSIIATPSSSNNAINNEKSIKESNCIPLQFGDISNPSKNLDIINETVMKSHFSVSIPSVQTSNIDETTSSTTISTSIMSTSPQVTPIPLTSKSEVSTHSSISDSIPLGISSPQTSVYSTPITASVTLPLLSCSLANNHCANSPILYSQNSPRIFPLSPLHSYPVIYAPMPNIPIYQSANDSSYEQNTPCNLSICSSSSHSPKLDVNDRLPLCASPSPTQDTSTPSKISCSSIESSAIQSGDSKHVKFSKHSDFEPTLSIIENSEAIEPNNETMNQIFSPLLTSETKSPRKRQDSYSTLNISGGDDSLDSSLSNSFLSANVCPISLSLISPSLSCVPSYGLHTNAILSPTEECIEPTLHSCVKLMYGELHGKKNLNSKEGNGDGLFSCKKNEPLLPKPCFPAESISTSSTNTVSFNCSLSKNFKSSSDPSTHCKVTTSNTLWLNKNDFCMKSLKNVSNNSANIINSMNLSPIVSEGSLSTPIKANISSVSSIKYVNNVSVNSDKSLSSNYSSIESKSYLNCPTTLTISNLSDNLVPDGVNNDIKTTYTSCIDPMNKNTCISDKVHFQDLSPIHLLNKNHTKSVESRMNPKYNLKTEHIFPKSSEKYHNTFSENSAHITSNMSTVNSESIQCTDAIHIQSYSNPVQSHKNNSVIDIPTISFCSINSGSSHISPKSTFSQLKSPDKSLTCFTTNVCNIIATSMISENMNSESSTNNDGSSKEIKSLDLKYEENILLTNNHDVSLATVSKSCDTTDISSTGYEIPMTIISSESMIPQAKAASSIVLNLSNAGSSANSASQFQLNSDPYRKTNDLLQNGTHSDEVCSSTPTHCFLPSYNTNQQKDVSSLSNHLTNKDSKSSVPLFQCEELISDVSSFLPDYLQDNDQCFLNHISINSIKSNAEIQFLHGQTFTTSKSLPVRNECTTEKLDSNSSRLLVDVANVNKLPVEHHIDPTRDLIEFNSPSSWSPPTSIDVCSNEMGFSSQGNCYSSQSHKPCLQDEHSSSNKHGSVSDQQILSVPWDSTKELGELSTKNDAPDHYLDTRSTDLENVNQKNNHRNVLKDSTSTTISKTNPTESNSISEFKHDIIKASQNSEIADIYSGDNCASDIQSHSIPKRRCIRQKNPKWKISSHSTRVTRSVAKKLKQKIVAQANCDFHTSNLEEVEMSVALENEPTESHTKSQGSSTDVEAKVPLDTIINSMSSNPHQMPLHHELSSHGQPLTHNSKYAITTDDTIIKTLHQATPYPMANTVECRVMPTSVLQERVQRNDTNYTEKNTISPITSGASNGAHLISKNDILPNTNKIEVNNDHVKNLIDQGRSSSVISTSYIIHSNPELMNATVSKEYSTSKLDNMCTEKQFRCQKQENFELNLTADSPVHSKNPQNESVTGDQFSPILVEHECSSHSQQVQHSNYVSSDYNLSNQQSSQYSSSSKNISIKNFSDISHEHISSNTYSQNLQCKPNTLSQDLPMELSTYGNENNLVTLQPNITYYPSHKTKSVQNHSHDQNHHVVEAHNNRTNSSIQTQHFVANTDALNYVNSYTQTHKPSVNNNDVGLNSSRNQVHTLFDSHRHRNQAVQSVNERVNRTSPRFASSSQTEDHAAHSVCDHSLSHLKVVNNLSIGVKHANPTNLLNVSNSNIHQSKMPIQMNNKHSHQKSVYLTQPAQIENYPQNLTSNKTQNKEFSFDHPVLLSDKNISTRSISSVTNQNHLNKNILNHTNHQSDDNLRGITQVDFINNSITNNIGIEEQNECIHEAKNNCVKDCPETANPLNKHLHISINSQDCIPNANSYLTDHSHTNNLQMKSSMSDLHQNRQDTNNLLQTNMSNMYHSYMKTGSQNTHMKHNSQIVNQLDSYCPDQIQSSMQSRNTNPGHQRNVFPNLSCTYSNSHDPLQNSLPHINPCNHTPVESNSNTLSYNHNLHVGNHGRNMNHVDPRNYINNYNADQNTNSQFQVPPQPGQILPNNMHSNNQVAQQQSYLLHMHANNYQNPSRISSQRVDMNQIPLSCGSNNIHCNMPHQAMPPSDNTLMSSLQSPIRNQPQSTVIGSSSIVHGSHNSASFTSQSHGSNVHVNTHLLEHRPTTINNINNHSNSNAVNRLVANKNSHNSMYSEESDQLVSNISQSTHINTNYNIANSAPRPTTRLRQTDINMLSTNQQANQLQSQLEYTLHMQNVHPGNSSLQMNCHNPSDHASLQTQLPYQENSSLNSNQVISNQHTTYNTQGIVNYSSLHYNDIQCMHNNSAPSYPDYQRSKHSTHGQHIYNSPNCDIHGNPLGYNEMSVSYVSNMMPAQTSSHKMGVFPSINNFPNIKLEQLHSYSKTTNMHTNNNNSSNHKSTSLEKKNSQPLPTIPHSSESFHNWDKSKSSSVNHVSVNSKINVKDSPVHPNVYSPLPNVPIEAIGNKLTPIQSEKYNSQPIIDTSNFKNDSSSIKTISCNVQSNSSTISLSNNDMLFPDTLQENSSTSIYHTPLPKMATQLSSQHQEKIAHGTSSAENSVSQNTDQKSFRVEPQQTPEDKLITTVYPKSTEKVDVLPNASTEPEFSKTSISLQSNASSLSLNVISLSNENVSPQVKMFSKSFIDAEFQNPDSRNKTTVSPLSTSEDLMVNNTRSSASNVAASIKPSTEVEIDIEDCDCSDDHVLDVDNGSDNIQSDFSETILEGKNEFPQNRVNVDKTNQCDATVDIISDMTPDIEIKEKSYHQLNPTVEPSGSNFVENKSSFMSTILSPHQDCSSSRSASPEVLRNVQEATEYHKPTLLMRNFKTKKHAKLQICRQCDQVFSTRQCLVRHIERRHKTTAEQFACQPCHKKFTSERALAKHMQQHKTYPCKLCGQDFLQRAQFKEHLQEHTQESLTCTRCHKECSSIQALISHISTHERVKSKNECEICQKTFANKRNLNVHLLIHTGGRPYNCSNCNKSFRVKSNMVAHRELCMDKCKFKCCLCSRNFALESVYKRHLAEHEGKHPYKCTECNKGFSKISGLKTHSLIHQTVQKKIPCLICGTEISSENRLRVHMKTHNKPSSVNCPVCHKELMKANQLPDHLARHNNKRNHKCPQCHQGFFYKCNVVSHMHSTHLKAKPHVCLTCHKTFSLKRTLNVHMTVHNGDKKHQCDNCGKAFATRSNYKRHLKCHVTVMSEDAHQNLYA